MTIQDTATAPRVVFLHGLESGPNGTKTQRMREAGIDVVAPAFEMGTNQWSRRNSVVRMLARLPELWAIAALGVGAVGLVARGMLLEGIGLVALALAWFAARKQKLVAVAVGRSFDACVRIARDTVRDAKPDVLVGSSWGGAVACELVRRGEYRGPLVLLAPASLRADAWMQRPDPDERLSLWRERAASANVVIFHDPTDDVVPLRESRALAEGGAAELRVVSAGGHRLGGLLDDGTLVAAVRSLASR